MRMGRKLPLRILSSKDNLSTSQTVNGPSSAVLLFRCMRQSGLRSSRNTSLQIETREKTTKTLMRRKMKIQTKPLQMDSSQDLQREVANTEVETDIMKKTLSPLRRRRKRNPALSRCSKLVPSRKTYLRTETKWYTSRVALSKRMKRQTKRRELARKARSTTATMQTNTGKPPRSATPLSKISLKRKASMNSSDHHIDMNKPSFLIRL